MLVSYLLPHGSVAWRAADHVLERGEPILSEATFDELWEVLHRPKFDRFVDPEVRRYAFLTRVLRHAAVVALRERIKACADPTTMSSSKVVRRCARATVVDGRGATEATRS